MVKAKLMSCPFCGAKSIECTRGITDMTFLFFKCKNPKCGAIVSFYNDVCNAKPEKAVEFWNRRLHENT